jgi:prepilin-type N-terminal cleavage/methylation domain-containing protein
VTEVMVAMGIFGIIASGFAGTMEAASHVQIA